MRYLADLHIHSSYSRATSPQCDASHLALWARRKGLDLVGTGDFTHPAWRAALRETLVPAEEGLYQLSDAYALPEDAGGEGTGTAPRFVISGEISSIYKRGGKTRKVHNVILLPSLEAAEALANRLERIGNIHSDGRPILGLDSRDLLEITLDTCPEAMFIPAHIWTPHFSLFGAFSGFDSIEECFGDLTGEVHALETGLSSDPPMNWRISALDRFTLVSNSDAHSPAKLGREANEIDGTLSYPGLKQAIHTGEGFIKTLEFFPEEGKYHLDGHRACKTCLTPEQTHALGGNCPVCGRKITIGVQNRATALADRPEGFVPEGAKPFESLVPLPEVIGASLNASAESKKTVALYTRMLQELGPEFSILRNVPVADISHVAGPCVAEGVHRLRQGKVTRIPGYDGEYGKIILFTPEEREELLGQAALFAIPANLAVKESADDPVANDFLTSPSGTSPARVEEAAPLRQSVPEAVMPGNPAASNPEQQAAIEADAAAVAVIAGPGTGKTSTLVARIAHLVEVCGVAPSEITAVTFTNQAAAEMQSRLSAKLGGTHALQGMTIGTFHAICLALTRSGNPIIGQSDALALMRTVLKDLGETCDAKEALRRVSRCKAGMIPSPSASTLSDTAIYEAYCARCAALGVRDLDDLLLDALDLPDVPAPMFMHLLVDEFQDVNPVQRRLVQKWSALGKGLFVIGDPDQSIYGFRGASAACFEELHLQFPDLATVSLTRNYRSTPEILHCACHVIGRNPGGIRALTPMLPSGAAVRFAAADSAFEEAVWISKEIARMAGGIDMLSATAAGRDHGSTRPFSDFAVLCRTHRQLEAIEACLVHDSIPCVACGREDFLSDNAVQEVLAFFRALTDPHYERYCPPQLTGELSEYRPLINTEPPHKLLQRYITVHGGGQGLDRLMNMAVFHSTMADFLFSLTLGEEGDLQRMSDKQYESGAVRLLTLHGAKGLEFPVVFLAGITEGLLPLTRVSGEADLSEERRLFFVGITRAKEALILSGAQPLSPFSKELPDAVNRERAFIHARDAASRQLKLF